MPIFKKNERSLVPFFEYLFSKIENINITEIENYNYEQLKNMSNVCNIQKHINHILKQQ